MLGYFGSEWALHWAVAFLCTALALRHLLNVYLEGTARLKRAAGSGLLAALSALVALVPPFTPEWLVPGVLCAAASAIEVLRFVRWEWVDTRYDEIQPGQVVLDMDEGWEVLANSEGPAGVFALQTRNLEGSLRNEVLGRADWWLPVRRRRVQRGAAGK